MEWLTKNTILDMSKTGNAERTRRAKEKQEKIRNEYSEMYGKGLRRDVIVPRLALKYFLSENTINAIIWKTAHYHEKKEKKDDDFKQLDLFS